MVGIISTTDTGYGNQTHRPKERAAKRSEDEARFEAWLRDFDTRQADLTARLDAILHSLGVDPAKMPEAA